MVQIVSSLALYFICWWITLFIILPIGIRTQGEAGEVEQGSVKSAPFDSQIKKRFFYTSICAFLPFGIITFMLEYDLFNFRNIVHITDTLLGS